MHTRDIHKALLPKPKKGCFGRLQDRWNSWNWSNRYWTNNLNSKTAVNDQNLGGYIVEGLNTLIPIAKVVTDIASFTGLSSVPWVVSSYAFVEEPSLGLTWGGFLVAAPIARKLAQIDVECHAAQSICMKDKVITNAIENKRSDASGESVSSVSSALPDSVAETRLAVFPSDQSSVPSRRFFADAPEDFLVEDILKDDKPLFITKSQFKLTKGHFFKDSLEKMSPPLMALTVLYNVLKLIPYVEDANKYYEGHTSENTRMALAISFKACLYLVLYHYASRASRLQLENTVEAFETVNKPRRLGSH